VAQTPLIIDEPPRGIPNRTRAWLRARRLMLAAALALVEVIAFIVWRPGAIASTVLAALVLVLAVMGLSGLRPGLLRELLWIVAIAQALVVALPLAVGISLLAGVLIVVAVLVAIIVIALRLR
jgi:hypothetical protein